MLHISQSKTYQIAFIEFSLPNINNTLQLLVITVLISQHYCYMVDAVQFDSSLPTLKFSKLNVAPL